MKKLQGVKKVVMSKWVAVNALMFSSVHVYADLPTTAAPTRGSTDGNFIKLIQDYAFDILVLAGLVVAAVAFFMVVSNTLKAYTDVGEKRGSWGAVGMHGGVGVTLLVLVVFLVTEASGIL